jgi:hypothetical protein
MSFCYIPQHLSVQTSNEVSYLFDASHTSLPLYFAQKGQRHQYQMVNADLFINDLKQVINVVAADYDVVIIPESRFPFLELITTDLQNVIKLKKRSKEQICALTQQNSQWRKLDVASAHKAWDEMGSSFTINKIKSNKRKDYVPYIFEPTTLPPGSRVLLLDDFIMSGNTIEAMLAALPGVTAQVFGIFYQC